MSTITSLKLGSVPITEEGVERYRFADPVENHFTQIYQSNDEMNCSVGRVFSKMKVPVSWIEVMNANYLIAEIEFNNPPGSSMNIRAWIDSIDLVSDSDDRPMVEIKWHFDYYEMYKSLVVLGYGHVKRRPFKDLATTPIQNYQYRYLELSPDVNIKLDPAFVKNTREVWWVIVNYNEGSGTSTKIVSRSWPVYLHYDAGTLYFEILDIRDNMTKTVSGPTIQDIMKGKIDEYLKIIPETIIGVWLSPIAPYGITVTDVYTPSGQGNTNTDPLRWPTAIGVTPNADKPSFGVFTALGSARSGSVSLTGFTPNEKDRYIVTGMDGSKLLDLPYGMLFDSVELTLYNEPDGPFIEVTFRDGSLGNVEGCTVNVPLPILPVNQNAWSSYVYSGKRDYDIEMRTIASNANAWKSSATGAGQGAMMGAFGPAGAAVGMAGGMAGGLISYGVEMLYQNDAEQAQEDRLAASQPSSLILPSGCVLTTFRHLGIYLRKLSIDSYSVEQMNNMISNKGISVDEIRSSCDALVRTDLPVGYYSIKNLIISGAAPKEAKDYIKKKFDAGVKLL